MRVKNPLRKEQTMPSAIADAREWAKFLVHRESRGPGDRENAMERVARRHGLTKGLLWSLLYRPPKDMLLSKFVSLQEAYLAECERQANALRHLQQIEQAKTRFGKAIIGLSSAMDRAADALDGGKE
jgi:hypothetical protein